MSLLDIILAPFDVLDAILGKLAGRKKPVPIKVATEVWQKSIDPEVYK